MREALLQRGEGWGEADFWRKVPLSPPGSSRWPRIDWRRKARRDVRHGYRSRDRAVRHRRGRPCRREFHVAVRLRAMPFGLRGRRRSVEVCELQANTTKQKKR